MERASGATGLRTRDLDKIHQTGLSAHRVRWRGGKVEEKTEEAKMKAVAETSAPGGR